MVDLQRAKFNGSNFLQSRSHVENQGDVGKSTMVEVERRGCQVSEIDRSKSWECTQSALVKPALSITGESILVTRTDIRFYAVGD